MSNTDTARERVFTSDSPRNVLSSWFNALQQRKAFFGGVPVSGRAWRAELRRAQAPYGVMMHEGFYALCQQLEKVMPLDNTDRLALAIFATVAAHVDANTTKPSFAAQLGENLQGRPCLSTLRFDALQQTTEQAEFCRLLIRAVKLRGGAGVNIVSLADGIFLWMREWQAREEHKPQERNPFERHHIRWASEYLSAGK